MTSVLMEFRLLFYFGLLLICCAVDRHVRYKGANAVWEGEPFEISCYLNYRDSEGWTVNSSAISEENDKGYILSERTLDTFREELVLQVRVAQLYHEGEYRCNKYSRDFHYVRVLRSFDEDQENEIAIEGDTYALKTHNEYLLEVNKTIEFHCSSAKDENTPVTWYKNSRRIVENSDSNILIAGLVLIIENAQEDDAGEYMCTIDTPFVTGYTDIGRIFRLNSPARIMDFPEKVNIIQERALNLHCKARGFPLPKITWYIGNLLASELKDSDLRISIYSQDGGETSSFLIVRDMSPSDRGLYTCKAENSIDSGMTVESDEQSVFVHVRENMIETNEDEPGMGKVLIPGEQLVLQCNTSECPYCVLVWFKDGERLNDIPGHLEIFEKNNSVVIQHSTYNDSGVYVCAIDREYLDVALNATIIVQSKIKIDKFDQSSTVVQGGPLELYCIAKGAPTPYIKWFIGEDEVFGDERVKLLDHEGLMKGKLLIEEADWDDRNHYTCEAYNRMDSVNTTIFIRVKDKLAALWPFLGICVEVAILCSIIFVYERRKSMNQCDEPETDLPADNKHRDQKGKAHDIRQRK